MNIGIPTLGIMSLYFFVGYLTSVFSVMLSVGIRTQFYSQLFDAIQKSPVISLLIAAPFVVLLGIFVNTIRVIILRILIKKQTYNFSALPAVLMEALKLTIATQLSLDQGQVNFQNDRHFETTKQLLLPEMDEYAIRAHWLHDLFENVVVVVVFSLIVLAFRAIVFDLKGIDWALVAFSTFVGFIAVIAISYLRRDYTISEVSLVIKNHRSQQLNRVLKGCQEQVREQKKQ